MLIYIFKRLFYSISSLFIIISLIFVIMHAIPGNIYSSDKALSPIIKKNIEAKYGLDKPLSSQYLLTLKNIATFDFGMSMKNEGRKVNDIIKEHFPKSAQLGLVAIFLCLLGGILLGILAAVRAEKWQDQIAMIIATIGVTVPSFVIASILQYYFSVKLKIFPSIGFDSLSSVILPAIALSFFPLSFISRLIRSGMIVALNQDYIRTARAKGLSESVVVFKHAFKNSLIPVITYLGPLIAGVLTGSFVIEKIFNIPGLGRFFVESISSRDYTVIMGVSIFYAIFLIAMNFLIDILYMFIDTRIKLVN